MEYFADTGEIWVTIPAAGEEYLSCSFRPIKGDYDKAKADIPAFSRTENFADFDSMYGADNLKIKVMKKGKCSKVNGIEVCVAEFKYDYQASPNQHTYYAIFKTGKGAYQAFFSGDAKIYKKNVECFKKAMASIKLL